MSVYRSRAVFLQRQNLAHEAQSVLERLTARQDIDVSPVQLSRVRVAGATRAADLLRARMAIKNAELRLKSLINDPGLDRLIATELIVRDAPAASRIRIDRRELLKDAYLRRPKLRQALDRFRAAHILEGIAGNEALPQLDLIFEGSHHAGDNESLFAPASRDPDNKFGFVAGVRFSIPIDGDERDARYRRRRIETVQQEYQVRTAIETVALELEVSLLRLS